MIIDDQIPSFDIKMVWTGSATNYSNVCQTIVKRISLKYSILPKIRGKITYFSEYDYMLENDVHHIVVFCVTKSKGTPLTKWTHIDEIPMDTTGKKWIHAVERREYYDDITNDSHPCIDSVCEEDDIKVKLDVISDILRTRDGDFLSDTGMMNVRCREQTLKRHLEGVYARERMLRLDPTYKRRLFE